MRDQEPDEWPHLLLMLGDQVYADEVAPATRGVHPRAPRRRRAARAAVADFEEYCRLYRDSWSEPARALAAVDGARRR